MELELNEYEEPEDLIKWEEFRNHLKKVVGFIVLPISGKERVIRIIFVFGYGHARNNIYRVARSCGIDLSDIIYVR